MASEQIEADALSPDALELIRLLNVHAVRYMIVGGEAVIFYGYPRLTGDIDFFYDAVPENVARLFACLAEFWGGSIPGVQSAVEFLEPGIVVQFGRPPHRIDLLSSVDGISFEEAWGGRVKVSIVQDGKTIGDATYIGKIALLKNKKASGRSKDLDDIEKLG